MRVSRGPRRNRLKADRGTEGDFWLLGYSMIEIDSETPMIKDKVSPLVSSSHGSMDGWGNGKAKEVKWRATPTRAGYLIAVGIGGNCQERERATAAICFVNQRVAFH